MSESKIKKDVWYVIGNTDNTEGRGRNVVLHTCQIRATAIRLSRKKGVMGSDAHIEKGIAFTDNNVTYGKVCIENPSREDVVYQQKIDDHEALIAKAKQLGLSEEEIKSLRK
tara:strand:+ start:338 stop:673 length:336 start_codon:yes stop_codon:yes gene_type:complete